MLGDSLWSGLVIRVLVLFGRVLEGVKVATKRSIIVLFIIGQCVAIWVGVRGLVDITGYIGIGLALLGGVDWCVHISIGLAVYSIELLIEVCGIDLLIIRLGSLHYPYCLGIIAVILDQGLVMDSGLGR